MVVLKFSLHHIGDAPKAIADVRRVLRQSGRFIVVDPVFCGSWFDRITLFGLVAHAALRQGLHELFCRYRTEDQIVELITRHGFTLVKKEGIPEFDKYSYITNRLFVFT